MKILKKGQEPSERVYQATCSYCKTEIEFLQAEGRIQRSQRDGDSISVDCPICKWSITKDLDGYIKPSLPFYYKQTTNTSAG